MANDISNQNKSRVADKTTGYLDTECMKYSLLLTLSAYVVDYIHPMQVHGVNLSNLLIRSGITHSPIHLGVLGVFSITWAFAYIYVKSVLYLFPYMRPALKEYIP